MINQNVVRSFCVKIPQVSLCATAIKLKVEKKPFNCRGELIRPVIRCTKETGQMLNLMIVSQSEEPQSITAIKLKLEKKPFNCRGELIRPVIRCTKETGQMLNSMVVSQSVEPQPESLCATSAAAKYK